MREWIDFLRTEGATIDAIGTVRLINGETPMLEGWRIDGLQTGWDVRFVERWGEFCRLQTPSAPDETKE